MVSVLGLFCLSPNFPQKEFSINLAVAFRPGFFLNAGIVQVYALSFSVLRQVLLLFFFRVTPSWTTSGFLL